MEKEYPLGSVKFEKTVIENLPSLECAALFKVEEVNLNHIGFGLENDQFYQLTSYNTSKPDSSLTSDGLLKEKKVRYWMRIEEVQRKMSPFH